MRKVKLLVAILLTGFIVSAQSNNIGSVSPIAVDTKSLIATNNSFSHFYLHSIPDTVPVADSVAVPRGSKKYHVDFWGTFGFSVLATAADIYAIPKIIHSKKDLTDAELQALNPNAFNGFDRWALNLDPTKRDKFYKISDITLPGIIVSAGILGFDKSISKDWWNILLMYYQMHAITFSVYNFSFFGPAFQNKYRPVVYYTQFPMSDRNGGNQRNSMYSGHVASSTAATFFMVKVYSDYHPEIGRKKYLLYALASVPPLIEGYFRVRALAHFPTDVMVGYLIGGICGIAVPEMHRIKKKNIQMDVSYNPFSGSPELSFKWQPLPKKIKLLNAFSDHSSPLTY